ncbi:nuclear pore complex protein Nup50 [Periplaneta americana]|uniref:RanBD1 domain-containing protein n=1 Tax=Periplaneta americana TaxID=6978 RepID=A0ABQ8TTM1_PERAM|nr:hypothetical protein ANN_01463 [Periplaneta americana]
MAKRNATSELNHDNWNEKEAPEEAGTFRKAAPDVMQNRIIKAAKRRSVGTPENNVASKSPFASFGGFKATSSNSTPTTSTFGFLANPKKSSETNGSSNKDSDNKDTDSKSPEYYSSLKGLNQCVSQWIKSHVDSNPFCILTPIFKDYERYLAEIDEKEAKRQLKDKTETTEPRSKSPEKSVPTSTTGSNSVTESDSEGTSTTEVRKLNPFTTTSFGSNATTFNFGSGASTGSNLTAGFTFGSSSSQPFTFSNVTKPDTKADDGKASGEEDEEQPPKAEFKLVVEEGAVYSKRCKVFVKKDSSFQERGVGTLYLKPVEEKTQLIVRADTSLGNLLVNTLLSAGMPVQRMGVNNVMIACVPTPETKPPPIPVLLRFKTSADADEALEKLKQYIK